MYQLLWKKCILVLLVLSIVVRDQVFSRETDSATHVDLVLSQVTNNNSEHYCAAAGVKGEYIQQFDVDTTTQGAVDITIFGCASLPSSKSDEQSTSLPRNPVYRKSKLAYWTCDDHVFCGSGLQILYNWVPSMGRSFRISDNAGLPIGSKVNISSLVMKVTFSTTANQSDYLGIQRVRVQYMEKPTALAENYMLVNQSLSKLLPNNGTKTHLTCNFDSAIAVQRFSDLSTVAHYHTEQRFMLAYVKDTLNTNAFQPHQFDSSEAQAHNNWKIFLKWFLVTDVSDRRLPKVMLGVDSEDKVLTSGDYMLVKCFVDRAKESAQFFIFPSTVDVCCFIHNSNIRITIDSGDQVLTNLCPAPSNVADQIKSTPPVISQAVSQSPTNTKTSQASNSGEVVSMENMENNTLLGNNSSSNKNDTNHHCPLMDIFLNKMNGTLPKRNKNKTKSKSTSDKDESEESSSMEIKVDEDEQNSVASASSSDDDSSNSTVTNNETWMKAGEKFKQASDWVAEQTGLSNASIIMIPLAVALIVLSLSFICCIALVKRRKCCKRRSEWSALRRGDRAYDNALLISNDDDEDEQHYTRDNDGQVSLNGTRNTATYNSRRLN